MDDWIYQKLRSAALNALFKVGAFRTRTSKYNPFNAFEVEELISVGWLRAGRYVCDSNANYLRKNARREMLKYMFGEVSRRDRLTFVSLDDLCVDHLEAILCDWSPEAFVDFEELIRPLAKDNQMILRMRFVDGIKLEAIGKTQNISYQAVNNRIKKSIEFLKIHKQVRIALEGAA